MTFNIELECAFAFFSAINSCSNTLSVYQNYAFAIKGCSLSIFFFQSISSHLAINTHTFRTKDASVSNDERLLPSKQGQSISQKVFIGSAVGGQH